MKSLLDKSFRYVPAIETNIRVAFARERRRIRDQKAADAARSATVTTLKKRTA